ncbi:VOC family protein [Cyanobacterium aponinum]|uniref:Glyoxalase/bleomycin resistance protein/dioxygenase n=1 Tax=Cyanobacterium aponinum (strain PCC 10605) TaxID=755178 RepID=K9Z8A6_CYAAP|nr:Glyoxalase/bleomycin resistance protein/dioxygenase [Cyanobacterium aponinum PCC 10605]
MIHHISIRTADIIGAIAFYELLGFTVKERFTTGYTLACWLEGEGGRLELMQIPEPKPAPDAFNDEHYVGYYHFTLDITEKQIDLPTWLEQLKQKFWRESQKDNSKISPLKILLPPQQQMIENQVYEVAFIADIDNLPIEIIRLCEKSP